MNYNAARHEPTTRSEHSLKNEAPIGDALCNQLQNNRWPRRRVLCGASTISAAFRMASALDGSTYFDLGALSNNLEGPRDASSVFFWEMAPDTASLLDKLHPRVDNLNINLFERANGDN